MHPVPVHLPSFPLPDVCIGMGFGVRGCPHSAPMLQVVLPLSTVVLSVEPDELPSSFSPSLVEVPVVHPVVPQLMSLLLLVILKEPLEVAVLCEIHPHTMPDPLPVLGHCGSDVQRILSVRHHKIGASFREPKTLSQTGVVSNKFLHMCPIRDLEDLAVPDACVLNISMMQTLRFFSPDFVDALFLSHLVEDCPLVVLLHVG